jgi:conjugal transfer pilus assembly protein TraB
MDEIVKKVKALFAKLPPNKRRYAMIGIAISVVIVGSVVAMLVGKQVVGTEKKVRPNGKSVEFYPLTGKDTGKLSGDVMAERIKLLESELDKLKSGETTPGQGKSEGSGAAAPDGAPKPAGGDPFAGNGVEGDAMPGQIFAPGVVPPPVRKKSAQEDPSLKAVAPATNEADALFPSVGGGKGKDGKSGSVNPSTDVSIDGFPTDGGTGKKISIREITEDDGSKGGKNNPVDGAFGSAAGNLQEQGLFMPAGSIISGVLITGMDAPTANQSKKEPFPVLIRIKDETLLPNRMKMDIRECFLIASGYGDMSTERAYLRAETVSCVREDGGVVETPLNAYSVGEDGKNGVRGRLVSKTGTLVAKSLMAGFLAGTADVLKPQKIQTTAQVGGGNQTQGFMNVDPDQVFSQGALGGLNNSMNKIADYYLEMARSIFPIIEIDPGRKIDFVVIRGAKLAIQSGSKGNQQNGRQQQRSSGGSANRSSSNTRSSGGNANSLNGF